MIIFGAGRIGRGFLAEIAANAGMDITFVDQDARLVDALNAARQYTIVKALPGGCKTVQINNFEAFTTAQEKEITARVSDKNAMVAIAVHPAALKSVARLLKCAIANRVQPLNVLLCVNMVSPAAVCREILPGDNVKFVDTVVMRMSPDAPEEWIKKDPLTVYNSGYPEMPYDAHAFVGVAPKGLRASCDIEAEELRKIYTLNMAHAVLSYLGAGRYVYASDAMSTLRGAVEDALSESAIGLVGECGFSADEMRMWNRDIVDMVDNPLLFDDLARLGADPVRKLSPTDRLVGSARLCVKFGAVPRALCKAIRAGYGHSEMREIVDKLGLSAALREISGITPGDGLYDLLTNEEEFS